MKTKVYSYLRVSGKGQIDKGGFPRQRDTINAYCVQNNCEVVREFVEKGVCGALDADDREALSELFEALKTNEIKTVLVETSQRLARDLMIGEIILSDMRKLGVKVISAESGLDLSVNDGEPTKTLCRQILSAIAQYDKAMTVAKLRASRQRIRATMGKCEGRKAYGATEPERATIALMRDLRASGLNPSAISRRLNADGIKPRGAVRDGKQTCWHPSSVSKILARQ